MPGTRFRIRPSRGFQVVVGLIIAMVGGALALPYLLGTNDIDFDPVRWRQHDANGGGLSPRYRMCSDLLRKHKLIGMTRSEIEALLGPIEYEGVGQSPAWDLGQVSGWPVTLPHGTTLRVQFGPDGRVWEVGSPVR